MYKKILKAIVVSGGLILNNFQGKVQRQSKDSDLDPQFVQKSSIAHTELDDLIQEISLEILYSHIPDIKLNVEEDTKRIEIFNGNNSDMTFHLDPLDGTYAYTENRDDFAIGAAISKNVEFIASAVYLPAKDKLYYADDEGTFEVEDSLGNSLNFNRKHPIIPKYVQKRCEDYIPVVEKLSLDKLESMSSHNTMMELVEGNAYLSLYHKAAPHDFGIPKIILESVGGICTNENGNPINFDNEFGRVEYFFAFASGSIKDQFFDMI